MWSFLLDGRSAARASQRDRGPSGEHPPAEPRAAAPDAHHRQLYSPGVPGVYVDALLWNHKFVLILQSIFSAQYV